MDTPSVSKTSPKLNLTHQQSSILRSVFAIGNNMSAALRDFDTNGLLKEEARSLAIKWDRLMQKLVLMFL